MKTKFTGIVVEIDDEKYVVDYSFASKEQLKAIEEFSKEEDEAVKNWEKLNDELVLLEEKRETNASLIPYLEGDDKFETLKEQRDILKKIEKLAPKVKKAAELELSDEIALKKYEMLVSGPDKQRLLEDAKKVNIPTAIVLQDIVAGVSKAKEKK